MGDAGSTTTVAPGGEGRSASAPRRLARAVRVRPALARGDALTWATGLVVFVLSWPVTGLEAQPGLDPSWGIGLHQAAHQGIAFGPDLLFTYGPLGFLRVPALVWPWTARLAFGYALVMHLALSLTLVWAIRRSTGSLVAAGLLGLLLSGVITQEPVLVIGFLWAAALPQLRAPRHAIALAAALGVLAGVELLAKFNAGVTVFALGVVAVAFAPRPRLPIAGAFAAGFLVAAAAGWFGTGQSLGNVPTFLSGMAGIASGYSEAMGYEEPGRLWEYWAALALVALGAVAAWTIVPRRARVGVLLLWLMLAFFVFKSGFVRHDGGHANIFFATMAGGLCAFAVPARHRVAAALAMLVALTALFGSSRANPTDALRPVARTKALVDQVKVLSDGSATNDAIAAGRDRVAASYGLDPESFAQVGDARVHVEPVSAGLAWAQRLRWDPIPVFQSYSAYTPALDRRNADALAAADGPERILREAGVTPDARNPAFESPAAMLAMLCHFRDLRTTARWQVLERVPDRCGDAVALDEVEVAYGAPVEIPAAPDRRSAVIAEVDGLEVSGFERLRTTALRARQRGIVFDGVRGNRLVPGTAGAGLILRVPEAADFAAPFALDQGASSMRFTKGTGTEQPGGELTVRFLAVPIR